MDQLSQALLLEQAVDERHVFRKIVVQDNAANCSFHVLLDILGRLSVNDVLRIERLGKIDDLAGVAQFNGGERFHFTHFERDQHVIG